MEYVAKLLEHWANCIRKTTMKDIILKTITLLACLLIVCACGMIEQEEPIWKCLICSGIAFTWLIPFAIANNRFDTFQRDED